MGYKINELEDGTFTAIDSGTAIRCRFESREAASYGAYVSNCTIDALTGGDISYVMTLSQMITASGGYGGSSRANQML